MEKLAYVLLGIVAGFWLLGLLFGLIAAFPIGLIGLLGVIGIGLLLIKVFKERLGNSEDDHYDRNVDQ
ncbi:hypothetical protein [Pseudomarimonas arenosa]|uniref:Uncharacterized protein n=1 Tax=Pseudomarimonas arenosa TaxID=2774145 RepID=A0AAW3ZLY3_9GAMM|nr:hypothetical protein [Pseudomarimonas arenosa]MBD8525659.1 hypothetical protein [Pseudomarimonas arenosa]